MGLACAAVVLLWQALTVKYSYGGNWTGLFCTGGTQPLPRDLLAETLYVLPGVPGYDGQFYHYIAHDPLGRSGLSNYVDAPALRYGRILVPGLAYLLAAGRSSLIDRAYVAVILLFVFLGAYWLSRFATLQQRSPAWGLLFLAIPATLVSIDRMTVDVALTALWAGLAVHSTAWSKRSPYFLLALAPLARETGLLMTAAYCVWAASRKEFKNAALAGLAAAPAVAWLLYIRRALPRYYARWLDTTPFRGLTEAIGHSLPGHAAGNVHLVIGGVANVVAVAGSLVAVLLAFRVRFDKSGGVLETALAIQSAVCLALVAAGSCDTWSHVYGYGRFLSPLLILLVSRYMVTQRWKDLTPLALLLPPIGLQAARQLEYVFRGLTSG